MHRVRVLESNWTQGNAIGFAVRKAGDKVYVSHGGSYPGYQTNTMLWLDGKVAVIVLTNADDGNPGGLATELMNTVGAAVGKASARPPAAVTWNPSWSRFAGLYRGRGGDSRVVELNRKLVIICVDERESRQPRSTRTDRRRAIPLRRRRRRWARRRNRAVRRRERPRDAHGHWRQLRGTRGTLMPRILAFRSVLALAAPAIGRRG